MSRIAVLCIIAVGCASGGNQYTALPSTQATPVQQIADGTQSPFPGADPYPIGSAIFDTGDLRTAVFVDRGNGLIAVFISVYNATEMQTHTINTSGIRVLDAQRMALRRLEPHEAANGILAQLREPPLYQPKYVIETTDRVTVKDGPGSSVKAEGESTSTVSEEPYSAAANAFNQALVRSGNQYIRDVAESVYQDGLVGSVPVPPRSGVRGAVYFRAPSENASRLTVMFDGHEIGFTLESP